MKSKFAEEYFWMKSTDPQSSAQIREFCNVLAWCDRMWNPNYIRDQHSMIPKKDSKRKARLVRMFWAFQKMGV